MKYGSLFSGIGGIDLGLDKAGLECAWQIEKDDFCRKVLQKHWPDVPKYEDVTEVNFRSLAPVDMLAGGFPCQDISNAGTTHEGGLRGLSGNRSGLWREFRRAICEMEPGWLVIENVGSLSVRGLDTVLWDMAQSGYDADWAVISASSMGASHLRKRLFIVGRRSLPDPDSTGLQGNERCILAQSKDWRSNADLARSNWRHAPPRVCRGSDGIPRRVDRLRSLGNAVVPQIPEYIGRLILEHEKT